MIGWHYTAESNWHAISRHGLEPYPIDKPELRGYFPDGVQGIWIWAEQSTPRGELGSIILQLSTKGDTRCVKLAVEYDPDEILHWHGRRVDLHHTGDVGAWMFHQERPEARILTEMIPPSRIKLLRTFDLMDAVRPPSRFRRLGTRP